MFRLSFFVEDKHLAEVLTNVAGRARDLQVLPVINAQPAANGKVKAQAGSKLELVEKALRKTSRGASVGISMMRIALKSAGLSPASAQHFLKELVKAGQLKKGERIGNTRSFAYDWVKP